MQRKWQRQWKRTIAKIILPSVAATLLFSAYSIAFANPTDGQVTTGVGVISQNGNVVTVAQTTDKLGVNWQSFNIGAGEKVQFIQPGVNSVALNRVIGSNPSAIYGTLAANGKVFLINPNGVLFAPGAQVNVGGLVASSLNIADSDFNAGKYNFSGNGGAVDNQGTITTSDGGYVALFGSQVKNEGIIAAKQGTVALGAGSRITLDMNGDGLLNMVVDQAALNASVTNHNLIQADGGTVIMTADAKNSLLKTVVSNSGIIQARSVSNQNGVIRLEGGAVTNSGTLDASGTASGQKGGSVKVLGETVTLANGAKINASGDVGGGTVLIGGNYQGKGTERNATTTTVAAATVNADAITSGDGGKVVVWADNTTIFQGSISAKGGALKGNGGHAEVSGKKVLRYQGTTDLRATQGKIGNLLLDPTNIVVSASGGDITGTDLGAAINTANVTLQADNDIQVYDDVTATTAGNGLTLQAGWSIVIDKNIKLNHGDFTAIMNNEGAQAVNRDAGAAKFQMNANTKINTDGGNVVITPGTFGGSQDGYVQIAGAIIDSGSGNINITGVTANGTDKGVVVENNSLLQSTGSGSITLNGVGKTGGQYSGGVSVSGIVQTQDGDITITGESRGTMDNNYGIEVDQGWIKSTGNGNVTLNGISGSGVNANYGIYINNGGQVQGKDGSLAIKGTSQGTGIGNHGIMISGGANIQSLGDTANSTVNITGISGSGTHDNFGMQINNSRIASVDGDVTLSGTGQGSEGFNVGVVTTGSSTIESTGTAKITINGTGGNGTADNYGIWMPSGAVKAVNGNIKLEGTAGNGTTYFNSGIRLDAGSLVQATGNAAVFVNGVGGSGNNYNYGVQLNGTNVTANSGKVSVTGVGGNGKYDYNAGIRVDNDSIIQSNSGDIELNGTGGNTTWDNYGLWVRSGDIKTVSGTIKAIGHAGGTGDNNSGIRIDTDGSIQATGNGNVELNGTGGACENGNNGIYMTGGLVASHGGNISFTGIGGAATGNFNTGIRMDDGVVQTDGTGKITFSGTGGNAQHDNYGIYLKQGVINTVDGNLQMTGIAHGSGFKNTGIRIDAAGQLKSTGQGNIILNGAGSSSATHDNHGVLFDGNQVQFANGNVQITGVGGGNGTDVANAGVVINNNVFSSAGTGSISITGTAGNETTQNHGVIVSGGLSGNGDMTLKTTTGDLIIDSGAKVASSNGNVTLVVSNGGDFINNSDANAISAGKRWLIYSGSPAGNVTGGLDYNFSQYGTNYGGTVLGTGNGFLYSSSLDLSASLTGTVTKTYDGNTAATLAANNFALTGLSGGTGIFGSSTGTYDTKNFGIGKTITAGVNLIGVNDANGKQVYGYNINGTASGAVGQINKANLTAALNGSIDKTYNGDASATLGNNYTLGGGFVIGDNVTVSAMSGDYDSKNAGARTMSFSGLSLGGSDAGNYTLNTTTLSGSGIINKASLTAALIGTVEKTYDGTTAATLNSGNYSLSGVIGSDGVKLVTPTSGTYADKNASSGKVVTVNGLNLSGTDAGNYTIASSVSGNVGVIDKAALTITATANTKIYDGTTSASVIPTVSGLQTGDMVTNLSEVYMDKNTGANKTLTVNGYMLEDGNGGNNYIVTTVNNTSGVITTSDSTPPPKPEPEPTPTPSALSSDPYRGAIVTAHDSDTDDENTLTSHSTDTNFHVVHKHGLDLTVVLPKADVVISADRQIEVSVPRDTLPWQDAAMQLTASQDNGKPLPSWLSFTPQIVRFYGQPPTGFSGTIHVRITARDTRGNETSAIFKLIIGEANDQGTLQADLSKSQNSLAD